MKSDTKDYLSAPQERKITNISNEYPVINTPLLGRARCMGFKQLWSALILSPILITSFLFYGCIVSVHDMKARNAVSYKYTSNEDGVIVAADPFFEEDRLRTYFGDDLVSKGVLPIFLLINNKEAEDGFILLNETAQVIIKKPDASNNEKNSSVDAGVSNNPFSYKQHPVGDFMTCMAFGYIGLFALEAHYTNVNIIVKNLEEKALVEKIIYKGVTHTGFLYFKINNTERIKSIEKLLLSLKNVRTGVIKTITIKMT